MKILNLKFHILLLFFSFLYLIRENFVQNIFQKEVVDSGIRVLPLIRVVSHYKNMRGFFKMSFNSKSIE